MTFSKKQTLSLLFFFQILSPLFATVIPVQLDTRIEGAKQIILAKAVAANSYWSQDKAHIYTAYTMETMAYLKENSSAATFELILQGGEIDGELEVVTPTINITIGQEYMLMVSEAPTALLNHSTTAAARSGLQFTPYAFVQGVLPYIDGKYQDLLAEMPMNEKDLVEKVQKITNMTPVTPTGEVYVPRVIIEDLDNDGVCSTLDCDDLDPNYPKPVGAACDDNNASTKNDQIQADGCTCAGNAGEVVNCENIVVTTGGGLIRIDNLTAKSEKVELIGSETGGVFSTICDGDCDETQYIEGLELGKKVLKITMYGADKTSCTKQITVEIEAFICTDSDKDKICDLKDCAPNDASLPTSPGTPCDDNNPATIRDIILADGCSCAGVESCDVPDQTNISLKTPEISIKNGLGAINPTFIAGTTESENDLVIEGSGFGTTSGTIHFPNGDAGGRSLIAISYTTDIVSWTDSEIRVKIPSKACSGTIHIKNSAGIIIGTGEIKIDYSINSLYSSFKDFAEKTRQDIKFTNRNQAGGYTIQLNKPTGFAESPAVAAMQRALNEWICATGVNWRIDNSGTDIGFFNDGICVALYEPNLPIGVLAITTSRYKASGNKDCNLHNTIWYLKEFDIQFLPNEKLGENYWNFAQWSPQPKAYDFESIVLHELGHAHGLGHILGGNEIMHYGISEGVAKRSVSHYATVAGNYKIALSSQPNCVSTHQPMTTLTGNCSNQNEKISTSAQVRVFLEGYYDMESQLMKTNLLNSNLLPDRQPFEDTDLNEGQQAIVLDNFPENVVDWLLIELRDENDVENIIAKKPVLLKNDGTLLDTDGSELITFDDLEDRNYYIALYHKSHLPIISNTAQPLNDDPVLFDFSASDDTTLGNNQQKKIDGKYQMNCGDFDRNGIINSLDFNLWKQAGAAVNSYSPADADGNGIINNQDFNLWKQNSSKVSALQRFRQ